MGVSVKLRTVVDATEAELGLATSTDQTVEQELKALTRWETSGQNLCISALRSILTAEAARSRKTITGMERKGNAGASGQDQQQNSGAHMEARTANALLVELCLIQKGSSVEMSQSQLKKLETTLTLSLLLRMTIHLYVQHPVLMELHHILAKSTNVFVKHLGCKRNTLSRFKTTGDKEL